MKTIAERLRYAREQRGWTQNQLAAASGLSQSTIGNIESGAREGRGSLPKIAKVLLVNHDWLADGEGPMLPVIAEASGAGPTARFGTPVASLGDDEPLSEDYIQIKETEVRFAAGNGRQAHFDEVSESVPRTYRRSWFVQEGINPEQARCFKVHGESMEPFLFDGDTVLVNLAETQVINGKVYAIRYGDELRIKRVYRKIDGGLVLHSDNPAFLPRDEDVPPAIVQEHIGIIGRVRDKSGTGGL